tara:strand:- start:897 stop:1754 length:858 start_codon:yes stop_codon:yes gene_type:complete
MDKIIGLGKLGCRIAEELSEHPEYRIYKILAKSSERATLSVGIQENMEAYEKTIDATEVEIYLRSIKSGEDVLLIVEGGDPISGATLKILETIKDSNIHILYVCPDRTMISEIQKRDDKIAFNIFQELARSGVFQRIFLVDKNLVEDLMGDVSVQNYEQNISYFISYVVAMINYFNHSDPVVSSKIEPPDHCRIATFGVSNLDSEEREVNLLFPMSHITDFHFFYGVPTNLLNSDGSLMKQIKNHIKGFKTSDQSTSFSVYETSFEQLMVLCCVFSQKIQQFATS